MLRNLRLFLLILPGIFCCILPSLSAAFPQNPIVIIDPGHGGSDTGIRGVNHLLEKNLSLALARELVQVNPQKYSLILTRETDFDPGPEDRAEKANHAKADLYVSLHAGSGFSQNPGPCRVFYKEKNAHENENPTQAWVLGQSAHIKDSVRLAEHLAKSLAQENTFTAIHTEEADSMILAPLAMPAVLIEFGNLLSPQDAMSLAEKKTQKQLASAIHRGISSYLAEREKEGAQKNPMEP